MCTLLANTATSTQPHTCVAALLESLLARVWLLPRQSLLFSFGCRHVRRQGSWFADYYGQYSNTRWEVSLLIVSPSPSSPPLHTLADPSSANVPARLVPLAWRVPAAKSPTTQIAFTVAAGIMLRRFGV